MRRLLIVAAIASTSLAGLGSAAIAQPYAQRAAPGGVQPGTEFGRQLDALEQRVQSGIRDGSIDRGESDRAIGELRSIRHELETRRHDGRLEEQDRIQLQERLNHLDRSIHWMRRNERNDQPGMARDNRGDEHRSDNRDQRHGWDGGRFWQGAPNSPNERIDWLRQRIRHGIDDGSLNRREAMRAISDLRSIESRTRILTRRDGGSLNEADRAYVQGRLDRLSQALRWAQHNDR